MNEDIDSEKPRILIVAADLDLQNILYYIVHKHGFTVEEADSLEETLEKSRLLQPALILLDFTMNGSAGFDTMRALQAEDETRRIPVVLMCDKHLGIFQRQMIYQESNVKAAMEKPVCAQTLLGIIQRLLQGGAAGQ